MLNTRCGRWAGICRKDAEAPRSGREADITYSPLPHPPTPPFLSGNPVNLAIYKPKSTADSFPALSVFNLSISSVWLVLSFFCAFFFSGPQADEFTEAAAPHLHVRHPKFLLWDLWATPDPMLSKELLSSFISFSRPASFYF